MSTDRNPHAEPRHTAGICFVLALLVIAVFAQTFHFGFVNYDDGYYVYNNPVILKGLSFDGIRWAFSHTHGTNWHPITSLSHMLDCQLFHEDAGWHHMVNVALHAIAAMLLFLVLREMTGSRWASAFAAAIFAIHPLRVESVAWISERKDVLSGVFFILTLWAYLRYTRKPDSWSRHLCISIVYALGLMSKPTLVPVPFVLLVLDYWPLKRLSRTRSKLDPEATGIPFSRLLAEKIPLFILSAAGCVATVAAQSKAIDLVSSTGYAARVANALVSYALYIGEMFYPVNLAVLYPRVETGPSAMQVVIAAAPLAAITTLAVAWARKRPWLLAGWLWYLVMLIPVLGLVQVGAQSHADRYTYLPQIGLIIACVWTVADFCKGWKLPHIVPAAAGFAIVAVLAFIAAQQTSYWRDSESLWLRTLACTSDNAIAHDNYGYYLYQQGRNREAIAQYKETLKIWPGNADTRSNYAIALGGLRKDDEAVKQYLMALAAKPDFFEAHNNIANILYREGDYEGALEHCEAALEINPDYADGHCMTAMVLEQMGRKDKALAHYSRALELKPNSPDIRENYAEMLSRNGLINAAIVQYRKALQLQPSSATAHYGLAMNMAMTGDSRNAVYHYQMALELNPQDLRYQCNLAWVLATTADSTVRNGPRAIEIAEKANTASGGNNPSVMRTLAASYAAVERYDDAAAIAEKAIPLALAASQKDVAHSLMRETGLYRARIPLYKQATN